MRGFLDLILAHIPRSFLEETMSTQALRQTISTASNHLHFVVCQDRFGRWIAIEDHDLAGGLFSTKEAALQYCAFESNHAVGAVELADGLAMLPSKAMPHLSVVRA